jgi:hypothetical protein
MDILDRIVGWFKELWSKVQDRFRPRSQKKRFPLYKELTRFFLTEAIEDRVKFLTGLADVSKEKEELHVSVLEEYTNRFEADIKRVCHSQLNLPIAKLILSGPGGLLEEITDAHYQEAVKLINLLRVRGVFGNTTLSRREAQAAWGLFLQAIQQVTLNIVSLDYPPNSGSGVSEDTQAVIRKTLARVDDLAKRTATTLQLKSPQKAEIELRVALARVKGDACLPLRPIPTAPLNNDDLARHYVGRSDEEALKLARQLRHADGTILVTGYRGVGKSTFVNRAVFHAISEQEKLPPDGTLLVPVTVNLAKVAGVQHVLRVTIRALRDALVDPESRIPRKIPCHNSNELGPIPLPLDQAKEIEPLEEAYIRATYKVTMSRSDGAERKAEFGSSFAIDPGKLVGGSIVGLELGKFLEGGIKKTSTKKINRELSLLDYDENAAEEDLSRLIRSLAIPRPLYGTSGPWVRIKLVFVFDELDKMDIDLGLKPMIEGLKNLFLQQYAVFLLVTSKKFYYDLLKDRAIEDAMLNSYFSAIVHVPLLSLSEVRKMVEDWIDWNVIPSVKERPQAENKLIEQLTRVLLYRSSGNPRDIIRELRKMQQWWKSTDQPYLSDQLRKAPSLQIIAAVQECIEKTTVREQTSTSPLGQANGTVALASERLEGDEARLEQVQRGLYILTEELINRGTLLLEPQQRRGASDETNGEKSAPVKDEPASSTGTLEQLLLKLAKPAPDTTEALPLAQIHKDNFSLVTFDDVQKLAKRLGQYLALVHNTPDLFTDEKWGERRPLFEMPNQDVLSVTQTFYLLTGRKATVAPAEVTPIPASNKSETDLIVDAKNLASLEGWAERLSAIKIIQQLGQLPGELEPFIWKIAQDDTDPNHRLLAIGRLTPQAFFAKKPLDISELLTKEKDPQILAAYLGLVGGAGDDEARNRATDALIALLEADTQSLLTERLSDNLGVQVLTVLQSVCNRDATATLLTWLSANPRGDQVQKAAVDVLKTFSNKFKADVANEVFGNEKALAQFTGAMRTFTWWTPNSPPQSPLKDYFREILLPEPTKYIGRLLDAPPGIDVSETLTFLCDAAFDVHKNDLATAIFDALLGPHETDIKPRLLAALPRTRDFQSRLVPYLKTQYDSLKTFTKISVEDSKRLSEFLEELGKIEAPEIPEVTLASKMKLSDFATVGKGNLGAILSGLNLPAHLSTPPTAGPISSSTFNVEDYVTQYNPPVTTTTPWSRRSRSKRWQAPVYLISAIVSFALGLYLFRRDLPAGASFATMLLSRLLLLALDATISVWFSVFTQSISESTAEFRRKSGERKVGGLGTNLYENYGTTDDSSWTKLISNPSVNILIAFFIAYVLYSVHVQYIGPLTRWNQLLQFLVNLPTIYLLLMAWVEFKFSR